MRWELYVVGALVRRVFWEAEVHRRRSNRICLRIPKPADLIAIIAYVHKQLGPSWEYLEAAPYKRLAVMFRVAHKQATEIAEEREEMILRMKGQSSRVQAL